MPKEKRTEESILLEQYGKLQLERETHLARLQDTEQKMMAVKKRLVEIEKAKTNGK